MQLVILPIKNFATLLLYAVPGVLAVRTNQTQCPHETMR